MSNWIWTMAGAAAAVVTAGAAVVLADKLMQKQQDKIDAMIRDNTPETDTEPETEALVQEETAQPVETEEAVEPAVQASESEVPVEKAEPEAPIYPTPTVGEDRPNPNPVMAGPAETPLTTDGKIDVSKLCDPADFCDWDAFGCRD